MHTASRWLGWILLPIVSGAVSLYAQTALTDQALQSWRTAGIRFAVFDIRGDAQIDSVIYPCFYTTQPEVWVDSLCRVMRVVISCHAGIAAQTKAQAMALASYPADSLYYTGYSLQSRHYAARDTLPLDFLKPGNSLPQSLPTTALWAVTLSKRPFQLIDVRGTGEITSGMIPGACNLVWPTQFQSSVPQLDKNKDVILSCASGYRAGLSRDYLLQNGFDSSRVINFGGFSKWSALVTAPVAATPSATCLCQCILTGIKPTRTLAQLTSLTLNPLPFSNRLTISGLPDKCSVLLIYDQQGVPARSFKQDELRAGTIEWDGKNSAGQIQAPGVYIVRLYSEATATDFAVLKIR